jgi:Flp pilus assembly protein TadD
VLPVDLSAHYETPLIPSLLDPTFLITSCIAIGYVLLAWYTLGRSRRAVLALVWVVLTITPVLNVIPLSDGNRFIAERYIYLPAVGFSVLVGHIIGRLWHVGQNPSRRWTRPATVFLACVLLQWYLFGTLNRNVVWRNEVNLWTDVVSRAPQSYQPYFNLAVARRNAGQFDKAIKLFEKSYEKAPGSEGKGIVLSNMALVFYLNKDYGRAKEYLEKALALIPENPGVYSLLGDVYFMQTAYEKALEQYEKALGLDPEFKRPLIGIGMAYFRLGRTDKTISHFEKVKSIIPNDGRLYYYLGAAYENRGMYEAAVEHYTVYLKLLPDDSKAPKIAARLKEMGAAPLPWKRAAPMKSR